MELTRKQEQGLRIAVENYENNIPYTVIAGYAGTGKSTLINFIIAALDLDPLNVAFIAYTGKAAQVLRSKGMKEAMTAHRLLYKTIRKRDGTFVHIPKDDIGNYDLIVVDEISMLPDRMWQLLLSHQIPIIACGDPFQLPPIGDDNHVLEHPDIFLDEIMRQAAESEIIRLSMDIRDRKPLKTFKGHEVNIVPHNGLTSGMMEWADQILCGKNATRFELNDFARRLKWGDVDLSAPLIGDRIICLRNDWDRITPTGDALVNGTIGTLTAIETSFHPILGKKCFINFKPDGEMEYDILGNPIDNQFHDLLIDYKLLTTHEPTITKQNYAMFPPQLRNSLDQFDYGYVITTHKSQGSEYPKVLVIEEVLKSTDHARWLYTACTRASEKLTIVKKDW